ncbi:glyoxalase superfamily protein [Mucilaginibacter psychrotolerans]|uniref:VOC family protein n=1 Tax=Mucilaginibacter psychrotolerans TaxID=1524096 RepID=A0A4Y8SEA4_9SPHI|nr:glyoxalase superfamily protein [Mucilaginibacter psychrotolerans]TFF36945.1 VOC family protein [Mucilaginibacter psychrotolerans]
MKILSTTPVSHVSDIKKTTAYYTNILGFSVDFEHGDYVGLTYGDAWIHLSEPKHNGIKKPAGKALFCFYCDDLNAYYHEVTAKGAILEFDIGDRSYGLRDFSVNDEDGNTLIFGMHLV